MDALAQNLDAPGLNSAWLARKHHTFRGFRLRARSATALALAAHACPNAAGALKMAARAYHGATMALEMAEEKGEGEKSNNPTLKSGGKKTED